MSGGSSRLRTLAAIATIGSDRAGDAGGAGAVLTNAATVGLQARAGWRPTVHVGHLPPAPEDDLPSAPAAARATLLRILDLADGALIEEWARLAIAHGVRADGSSAPAVLDWWARQPQRSPAVFEMLGRRGAWLASLNPDWRKPVATAAIPDDADEVWSTGTTPERTAVLVSVRRIDPPRALALVASTWKQDGAAERKAFLEVLFDRRSLDDELFLEAALDDRSKQVRRLAAAILAALPGSRLRERMAARAAAIVSAVPARRGVLGGKPSRIAIEPPAVFDRSWDRDGIDEQPAPGIGPRAWWTRQILRATDLSFWTSLTSLDPEGIFAALEGDEYAGEVEQALIVAARTAGDVAWSAALARRLTRRTPVDVATLWSIVRALTHHAREELCLEIAAQAQVTVAERWMICSAIDGAWSPEFSTAALALLGDARLREPAEIFAVARAADLVSHNVSPQAAEAFEDAILRLTSNAPTDSLSRSIDRVRLRADMHKEFTS